MEGFNERSKEGLRFLRNSGKVSKSVWFQIIAITLAFIFFRPALTQALDKGSMMVLPFRIYGEEPMEHLKKGLQEMLTERLGQKGYDMVPVDVVNKHRLSTLPQFENEDLLEIGRDLGAGRVVSGSVTQVGKRLSVDLKVVDVSQEAGPFSVFMVAENVEALAGTMERVAVTIDHKITGVVQVDSLEIVGNQRVDEEAIKAVISTQKGDRLDQERLDKDLRSVYKMGYFTDVKIETEEGPRGKIVTFQVREKPSVAKIVFQGNAEIEDKDLREQLGIKPYDLIDQNEINQSIKRLRDLYRKKGYYNVDIIDRVELLPNNEVVVRYKIEENEKVYIDKIEFVGNNYFDDGDLKDLMETSEKGFFPWLSWITKWGYLDRNKLEYDLHKITSFYHNHGFINAKVGEPDISYSKGKGLTITIEVMEGDQYGVSDVAFKGDLIKPVDELKDKVEIHRKDVFSREVVREDIQALKRIYADEGYAYADVSTSTKEEEEKKLVEVTYRISKNEKVRFERIDITGNTYTRDKVIRRELEIVEGEYFDGKALKKSARNLNRLGFFEDVQIKTEKGSADDLMRVDIHVKERPTGAFSFGAGYSSAEGMFGIAEVSQENLFGYGQKLKASGKLGGKSTQFQLSFTEPWLLGKPISASITAYKWEYEYDEYTKDSLGGSVGFGFPLPFIPDEYTRGSVRYIFDNAEVTDIDEDASHWIWDMEGQNIKSSMTFGVQRDSRDRMWNTSEGSVNSTSVEVAGGPFGGDFDFNKYHVRSAWYFPFLWDTVFMVQGRFSYLQERGDEDVPVYEKLVAGGLNTVRGFEHGDLSPREPSSGDKVGGDMMWIGNLEYRFPLLKDQGVIGLVFFDIGKVATSEDDVLERSVGMGTGVGVRWYSPFGPLRLEWGYNLDPKKEFPWEEDVHTMEFSIGTTF